jgi:hypothetical protein
MKKILTILMTVLSLSLVGCSSKEEEIITQDANFVKSIEKATQDRWDYANDVESGEIAINDNLDYLTELVKKESDELYQYIDAEFSDVRLKKLAMDYINGVKAQEEALKYYIADYSKYDSKWLEGYNLRSTALVELVEEYGINVDEKELEELKNNVLVITENKELEESIEAMVSSIEFTLDKKEYGFTYYSAIVENTTDLKFDSFSLDLSLLDSDGVVVDTEYVFASNWKQGQKYKFEFMTDRNFETIEWEYSYYKE